MGLGPGKIGWEILNSFFVILIVIPLLVLKPIFAAAETCRSAFFEPQLQGLRSVQSELLSRIYRKYGETDRLISSILSSLVAQQEFGFDFVERAYRLNLESSVGANDRQDAVRAAHLTVASLRSKYLGQWLKVRDVQEVVQAQLSRVSQGTLSESLLSSEQMVASLLTKTLFLKFSSGNPRILVPKIVSIYLRLIDELARSEGSMTSYPRTTQEIQIIAAHLTSAVLQSNQTAAQVVSAFSDLKNGNFYLAKSPSAQLWRNETAAILTSSYLKSKMNMGSFGLLFQDIRRGATRNLTHEDDFQAGYLIYSVLGP